MRFAGIDIAAESHVVAVVAEDGSTLEKPTSFGEDAAGYARLMEVLGAAEDLVIAMEATGHYWQNLFAALAGAGYAVALLNPLRTRRFAGEDLERTKTDAIDALGIARFAVQKRPKTTSLPDAATQELRELVRLRDRLTQDFGDRVRQLHRLVDLGFPEFTRIVRSLDSSLATTILHEYPTAEAYLDLPWKRLAKLCSHGRRQVGADTARALVEAARTSVGRHHGPAYRVQIRYACEDLDVLRRRLAQVDNDIGRALRDHEVGTLLTTIDGVGPTTAARLVAEFGDIAAYRGAAALAAYVGAVPALRQSGKRQTQRAQLTPYGNARLRAKLWMPTLTAVRRNPWLRAYYEGLLRRGKAPKVALVAAMRKLLIAVYFVATHRKAFIPVVAEARA